MMIFKNDIPLDLTQAQKEVSSKFNMLHRASTHINSAGLNQLLSNMEILAFRISWFSLVSGGFEFADTNA
jgi:hypothetical protein